jgi:DNA-binding MarR family transcriptional regulator
VTPKPDRAAAVLELCDEVILTFHRLKRVAENLHAEGEMSGGLRGVLRNVRDGARTVPELARMRPVSRQHIQTLVNDLLERGFVEMRPNPAHQRSHRVTITPRGEQRLARMEAEERKILGALPIFLSPREMTQAIKTLRELRQALGEIAGRAAK